MLTSRIVKMAEKAVPATKTRRKTRWRFSNRLVSKIERRIRPAPPMKDQMIANAEKTFSRVRIFGRSLDEKNKFQFENVAHDKV